MVGRLAACPVMCISFGGGFLNLEPGIGALHPAWRPAAYDPPTVNFARDVVDSCPAGAMALVALGRDGSRTRDRLRRGGRPLGPAGRHPGRARGAGRGDVVMTLIGNRPEWVYAMVACFRIGAVALPCTEQLRPGDLRARIEAVEPRLVVADERNLETVAATASTGPVLAVPDERAVRRRPRAGRRPGPHRPGADHLHLGHRRRAQADPPRPALPRRASACRPSTGSARARATCAGARRRSGWSKSARNVFIAPWLRGAAALLHDARFDPEERLAMVEREGVNVLCMAPTEWRTVAKRTALRPLPDAAPRGGGRRAAQPRDRARGRRRSASRSTTATGRPRPAR